MPLPYSTLPLQFSNPTETSLYSTLPLQYPNSTVPPLQYPILKDPSPTVPFPYSTLPSTLPSPYSTLTLNTGTLCNCFWPFAEFCPTYLSPSLSGRSHRLSGSGLFLSLIFFYNEKQLPVGNLIRSHLAATVTSEPDGPQLKSRRRSAGASGACAPCTRTKVSADVKISWWVRKR